jgi:hypothetical protein
MHAWVGSPLLEVVVPLELVVLPLEVPPEDDEVEEEALPEDEPLELPPGS